MDDAWVCVVLVLVLDAARTREWKGQDKTSPDRLPRTSRAVPVPVAAAGPGSMYTSQDTPSEGSSPVFQATGSVGASAGAGLVDA